ncbi:MAG TPA: ABC transporter substrate-binding protein [Bacillales bacterium]
MKGIKMAILALVAAIMFSACGNTNGGDQAAQTQLLDQSWDEIVSRAEGTTVHLFMWGGDSGANAYIDDWLAPRLKKKYGITLKRHPMDTADFIQKLLQEKRAGKQQGTMDVIWINGINFRNAKKHELLWKPFVSKLPNYQKYINHEALNVHYDMGTKIEGLEAPWGKTQFVYIYDSAKMDDPPDSFGELKSWVKAHPGKFSYPNVHDFTGFTFVKHVLYKAAGENKKAIEKGFNQTWIDEHGGEVWSYLNAIEPYLWRKGKTYPQSRERLDQLYSKGQVWMTMGFGATRAQSLIQKGVFPKTTRTFVMSSPGSIGNTNYLSIPFNSPNKAGAMVTINFLESPEAQLKKLDPAMWGGNTVLDISKLQEKYQKKFKNLQRGPSVLSAEKLQSVLLPDLDAGYAEWIKENWLNEVVQK